MVPGREPNFWQDFHPAHLGTSRHKLSVQGCLDTFNKGSYILKNTFVIWGKNSHRDGWPDFWHQVFSSGFSQIFRFANFTHINERWKCRSRDIQSSSNCMPFVSNFWVQNCSPKCKNSLKWPSKVLVFCVLINYNILCTVKTVLACFGRVWP